MLHFSDRWDKFFYESTKKVEKKYMDIIDNNFKTVRDIQKVKFFLKPSRVAFFINCSLFITSRKTVKLVYICM